MSRSIDDESKMKEIDITSAHDSSRDHNSHSGRVANIHKVRKPPKQKLIDEISYTVKETFFPDDPFRSFRDQSTSKKLWLFLQGLFPILSWSRGYNLNKFKGDLIAGLTIASLCIPQVLHVNLSILLKA